MHSIYTLSVALLTLGLSTALPAHSSSSSSTTPQKVNGKYVLKERDTAFDNHVTYSFDQAGGLPSGLSASNYAINGAPRAHSFTPDNAAVADGYLQLKVPGGQNSGTITCAEVTTDVSNILYASVRTVAIFSDPAGVCNGNFFYKSDSQETDIEWLSDPQSQSNAGTRKLWLTNQDANGDGVKSYTGVSPPADATSAEHEYRIDWTEGLTVWYVDGVEQWRTTSDVPSTPGSWIWNNWSDGDEGWSAGPPSEDAIFKIKSIDMYYNTA